MTLREKRKKKLQDHGFDKRGVDRILGLMEKFKAQKWLVEDVEETNRRYKR